MFCHYAAVPACLTNTAGLGIVKGENANFVDTDGRPEIESNYPYADEAGFLSTNNFTDAERAVMKTVSQWQDLPVDKLDLATNGINYPYIISYEKVISGMGDVAVMGSISIEEYADSYKGAMYRIDDTMFLLNPPQLLDVYNCYGTLAAEVAETPLPGTNQSAEYYGYSYWLRSQRYGIASELLGDKNTYSFLTAYSKGLSSGSSSGTELGIRPAFYLNEAAAVIASGSGTAEDPYILTSNGPQEGVAVYCNGEPVEMDQSPVEENDRLLVPMRAIFESLGAEVSWYEDSQAIAAQQDETTVYMQIDDGYMSVNDEWIALDAPPRLVGDRTLVPVRAVSEALDARVEWNDELQRVIIDKQPEWVDSGWCPDWYAQALKEIRFELPK